MLSYFGYYKYTFQSNFKEANEKPERRLFVSVACAAALMVCGAVMMHLDKKPDEATFFAMDCPCTAAVYGGEAEQVKERMCGLEALSGPSREGLLIVPMRWAGLSFLRKLHSL